MTDQLAVDPVALRAQVTDKYREVATNPGGEFHFHTGRRLASHLGYPDDTVAALPDSAVESFAGVGNPFVLRSLEPGERVVDVGVGAGFDAFVAARQVGADGRVIGVDMTEEMVDKARRNAEQLGMDHVDIRTGLVEDLPIEDGWADTIISNGVINLCADKQAAFAELHRVLRKGGRLQFSDIATGNPVPREAIEDIDLWTD